ncbi:hypothetical protein SPI_06536 [Niveomyces insectorum RCEF 264]|uniref:2EXR domain-containing protein n=1 Tax=Niveomyces insectorum RCEF 264 TaxID=1081102 RepID=A0A167RCI8_9HYPO|nr:hypothetical protein SPI_06536 [Niveomyces insectorum RCEF 264]
MVEFDFNTAPAPDEVVTMQSESEADADAASAGVGSVDGDETPAEVEISSDDGSGLDEDRTDAFTRSLILREARESHPSDDSDEDDDSVDDEDDDDDDDEDDEDDDEDDEGNSDEEQLLYSLGSGGAQYVTRRPGYEGGRKAAWTKLGPQAFPQFSRLPAELRLRIWEMHCPAVCLRTRIVQVMLVDTGRLVPASTLARQTRNVRRFMRVSRETRARGLQALPDTLPIGATAPDPAVLRFDAHNDIVHFEYEDSRAVPLADDKGTAAALYGHVRNLALKDCVTRSRAPGVYYDRAYGRGVFQFLSAEDVSHRAPLELRPPTYCANLVAMFPRLANLYVVERGSMRRLDRWIGHKGSYEKYHIRTSESTGAYGEWVPVDYVYCWHPPPPKSRRRRMSPPGKTRTAGAADNDGGKGAVTDEHDEDAAESSRKNETSETNTTSEETSAEQAKAEETGRGTKRNSEARSEGDADDDGDFKEECVINHIAAFKERGVRFSRMLFMMDEGLELFYWLRDACGPDGTWPNDEDGKPLQDSAPDYSDEEAVYGGMSEDEYESEGIDDDDLEEEEGNSDDDDDDDDDDESDEEDDLEVVSLSDDDDDGDGDGDDGGDGAARRPGRIRGDPLEANFSSPEPEGEVLLQPGGSNRGTKRRIITDSDDEEGDAANEDGSNGDEDGPLTAATNHKAKRRRRAALSSDEDEDEEEKEEEEEEAAAGKTHAGSRKPSKLSADEDDDSDAVSSYTEGDASEPSRPLTLAQRLQLGRAKNPIPSSNDSSDDDEEEENDDDDDDDASSAADGSQDDVGDYVAGNEDEDNDEDEDEDDQ